MNYKKLKTIYGDFYYTTDEEPECFYCKLYDSNKNWVANITCESTIEKIKNMQIMEDFVKIGIADNVIWSDDIDDLFDNFMETLQIEYIEEEYVDEFEYFRDYVNQVGNTYFVLDYDNI